MTEWRVTIEMKRKQYKEQKFTGERALYQCDGAEFFCCTFADGESPLKESGNLILHNSLFQWKYPLWYCENVVARDCVWFEMARAGVWYTNHMEVKDSVIEAPKNFRRCQDLVLERVNFSNAEETLWHCNQVILKKVTAKGDYFAMNSQDMTIEDFTLTGNYSFDGVKNVTVRGARMLSRDAFWNSENVTIYDSFISGEYFGWNSKNITLINCTIESEQGLCYIENLVMKDCKLLNTNLAFEYASVDAEINSYIDSVKNPVSGRIQAKSIGEVIFDNPDVEKEATQIVTEYEAADYFRD